jgi:hypothetical protein
MTGGVKGERRDNKHVFKRGVRGFADSRIYHLAYGA